MRSLVLLLAVPAAAEVQSLEIRNFQLLMDETVALSRAKARDGVRVLGLEHLQLPDGAVLAQRVGDGANEWLRARGIQYAEHPEGELRWQPPVPRGPWSGEVDATEFGDDCVNAPYLSALNHIGNSPMSERCLYMNVWAPVPPSNSTASVEGGRPLLPVLFWMHGGSFVMGGATEYAADRMLSSRQDWLVVVPNYRLGAFGWLGGQHVAALTSDGSSGNFGLQDTREALRWVQRNIGAFGGDASRVTIAGESSGASMVETHLAAHRSAGLFQQAIMQSGAFDNYTVQSDPDAGFAAFASLAGCDPAGAAALACLRAAPLRALGDGPELMRAVANTSASGWFSPAVDGVELVEPPEVSAAAGRLNPMRAVLLGSNLDEGRLLMPLTMPVANAPHSTRADLAAWFGANFGRAAAAPLSALYRDEAAADGAWAAAAKAYTDGQYLCPTARSARWLHARGVPSYSYRLEYAPRFYHDAGVLLYWQEFCKDYARCANATAVALGVGHGADVPLLFNDSRLNATDRAVARTLIDYWASFAASGDPNPPTPVTRTREEQGGAARGGVLPHWPSSPGATMRLSVRPVVERAVLRQSKCAWWDAQHPVPYPPPAPSGVVERRA